MKFLCFRCETLAPTEEMNLDASSRLVCTACYIANPPQIDVDGVFAEVVTRIRREALDGR